MYSILKGNEKNIKKAKGVKKCVVKKRIMHEQYKETLFGKKQLWHGRTFFEARSMRFTAFMLTKSRFPHLIQSDG